MDDQGAGIVMQPETITLLERVQKGGAGKVSVSCETRRYLRRDGGTKAEMPMAQRFTSWGALYHTLRAAFPSDRYLQGHTLRELLPGSKVSSWETVPNSRRAERFAASREDVPSNSTNSIHECVIRPKDHPEP
jgi:hypothetical protein